MYFETSPSWIWKLTEHILPDGPLNIFEGNKWPWSLQLSIQYDLSSVSQGVPQVAALAVRGGMLHTSNITSTRSTHVRSPRYVGHTRDFLKYVNLMLLVTVIMLSFVTVTRSSYTSVQDFWNVGTSANTCLCVPQTRDERLRVHSRYTKAN
jgi:hypothetical protein